MVRGFLDRDFVSCGVEVLNKRFRELFKLFIMIVWAIWSDKNIIMHGDEGRDAKWISFSMCDYLISFKKARIFPSLIQSLPSNRWMPPQSGHLKLTVDAVMDDLSWVIGSGVVIQDNAWSVLTAVSIRKAIAFSVRLRRL